MAPDVSFSLFPKPESDYNQKPKHKRKSSSKSSTSPTSSWSSPVTIKSSDSTCSTPVNPSLKVSNEFERKLDTVHEENSTEHSPIAPCVSLPKLPSTFVGPIPAPNSKVARRSRTPSPPRIHTDFSKPFPSTNSPLKGQKPTLRTTQLPSQGSYTLPLSPPPADGLPPLPAHAETRRKSMPTGHSQSPATTLSPSSSLSPSSAQPPSSATTNSPHTPQQLHGNTVGTHRKESSSVSTTQSISSPQMATTSPQFAFSPSLISSKQKPVAYPSIPQSQSPPITAFKSSSGTRLPHSPSTPTLASAPLPQSTPPHRRPRRPSDPESNFSGTTARTFTSPPRPTKTSGSIFPTYDPSIPLEAQQKKYGPRQQLQYGGYYAPSSSLPKPLHHASSSHQLASRPKLTARALEEHQQSFDAPPMRVSTAPTLAKQGPRHATPAPSIAVSNRPPLPRANSVSHCAPPNYSRQLVQKNADVDPALIKTSWNALSFVVGVGVEVVGGAMGGLKSGIKKERAKREKRRVKKEMKSARSTSRWQSVADGSEMGYGSRFIEVEAKVSDNAGVEVRKERIDFRI